MKIDIKKLWNDRNAKAGVGRAKVTELNALLDKANPTAEDQEKITALEAEVDKLQGEVAAIDQQIDTEEKRMAREKVFVLRANHGSLLQNDPEKTDGFRSVAEFALAVRAAFGGRIDQRLLAAPSGQMQNEGAGNEGYLVPAQWRADMWEIAFSPDDLLGMVTPEPTTSNAVALGKDETTPWGATGIQATWRAEGNQLTASKLAPTGALVQLHELYAFVIATNELLEDAPRLNDRLTNKAGLALRWKAGDAIMWGTGQGQPLGYMKAPSLITVNKDSGQASKTLSVANILNMSARLLRIGGGKAIWMGNGDIIPQLGQLTIGNVPAWLPLNSPIAGPFEGTLGGRSFFPNEHSDTLGNTGDLTLMDPSGYYAITKAGGGIDYAASIHLFFDYGMSAFRWTFRFGGQPFLSTPVSPARGTTTKSHFVALQAR